MEIFKFAAIALIAIVLVSGCSSLQNSQNTNLADVGKQIPVENRAGISELENNRQPLETQPKFDNTNLLKLAGSYYRYDPVQYENAINDGKVVYLYFYANWCPICKEMRPKVLEVFNKIKYADVVGFEVHFNDDEQKDFDREIIRKYQIPYQHTTVIDRNGKEVYRSLEALTVQDIIAQIEKVRSS